MCITPLLFTLQHQAIFQGQNKKTNSSFNNATVKRWSWFFKDNFMEIFTKN
jgi:hypothetical protein